MWNKIKWVLLCLLIFIVGILAYYIYTFFHFADQINKPIEDSRFEVFQDVPKKDPPKWEGTERVNIILLGGDSRGLHEGEIPRSDSIMLVSLDPVTHQAYLFSILRDTYVPIPSHGKDRINAAIVLGGPSLVMETVSSLLDIPIQYYVYTDFKGFIALIDTIGGIDFEVEKNMKYSDATEPIYDIDLKKGMQHLDGNTALQYVRFRHDAMSDFTRTERQRNFLKALAIELQSTSSLLKLPKILNTIQPYIETNLSATDMLKLSSLGYESRTDGLVSEQLPPLELLREVTVGGAAVITADEEKLRQFVQSKFDVPDLLESPGIPGSEQLSSTP